MARRAPGLALVAACLLIATAAPANASTITVNTTADDNVVNGNCTLREAIISANSNGVSPTDACTLGQAGGFGDDIQFALGAGTPEIAVTGSALPSIVDRAHIVGSTGGATRVVLNGTGAPVGSDGLNITANSSTVRDMVINRFGTGVEMSGTGNEVSGSRIGTDPTGGTDLGNTGNGIEVTGGSGNRIGGTAGTTPGGACTGDCNVISGNNGHGVLAASGGTTLIQGNMIGLNAAGAADLGNSLSGVFASGPNNQIGGNINARNVISGNGDHGVDIGPSSIGSNFVRGNLIGTNAAGSGGRGNDEVGVRIVSSPNNTIGGGSGLGNLISDNGLAGAIGGDGVLIDGAASTGNLVAGNVIGLAAFTGNALGNAGDGVQTQNAVGNTIGGDAPDERNVISANEDGIDLNAASSGNRVTGNLIGTDFDGVLARGNGVGIAVDGTDNVIGGTAGVTPGGACTGECNLISANVIGVRVGTLNAATSNNSVVGNYIGTDENGAADVGNSTGIQVTSPAANTTIGGASAEARNVIGGNVTGIRIQGTASGTNVLGNFIGLTSSGAARANDVGVDLQGLPTNSAVGGDTAASENVISNHPAAGIRISGDDNDGHVVARNRGEANGLFLDLASPTGPGTDPTGANGGAQPPVVTAAGAGAAVGTAPPGATVRVFSGSNAGGANVTGVSGFVGSATADGSGQWVAPYANPPAPGQTVAATQTTAFGTSEFSVASSLDVAPPDTSITAGPDAGAVTNDSTPTFEFSSEAGATFECSIDGSAFGSCSSPHTTGLLGDGTHTLRVRAVDASQNADQSPAERTFSVDATAPDTSINSRPAPASRDTTPTIAFSASEPGSRFECRLNGTGAFAACTSAHTRTVPEGSHLFEVRAIDAAGNVDAAPATVTFVVDRTRPKASKLRSRARKPRGRTFTYTLNEAGATTITIDRKVGRKFKRRGSAKQKTAKKGKNSLAFKGTLARGSYRASIVVTDPAGNRSKVARATFTVR